MNFDIANLNFIIGQKENNIIAIWLPMLIGALATLTGAFIGSYVSAQLNKYQKIIAIDNENSQMISTLLYLLDNLFNNLIASYTDDFTEFYISVKTKNLNIFVDINNYLFLSKYSNQILPLLNLIKSNMNSINFYISSVEHRNKVPQEIILNTLYCINYVGEKLVQIYKNNTLVNLTLFNTKQNNDELKRLRTENNTKQRYKIKDENIKEWTKISPINFWTILKELFIFMRPCFLNKTGGRK